MLIPLISSSQALPFVLSLGLMFLIALLEGMSTLMGMGFSGVIDGMLPELDVDADLDIDGEPSAQAAGIFTKILGWMHVGRVPVLILFIVYLTAFGLTGLFTQAIFAGIVGRHLPALVACAPATFTALISVRILGGFLGKLIPKDETDAVSSHSFIGRVATLGAATATTNNPAQAKLKDQHGQVHYLLVEPDEIGVVLEAGAEVVLVRQAGARFFAIRNTNSALSPTTVKRV